VALRCLAVLKLLLMLKGLLQQLLGLLVVELGLEVVVSAACTLTTTSFVLVLASVFCLLCGLCLSRSLFFSRALVR